MKTIYLTIAIATVLGSAPAYAESEGKTLAEFEKDVAAIDRAVTSADLETGDQAKRFDREDFLNQLRKSTGVVNTMRVRAWELSRHVEAIRSAGAIEDDPEQLENFCKDTTLHDLNRSTAAQLIGDAYDREADAFEHLKSRLEPLAAENFAVNAAWKPQGSYALPGGFVPGSESAREYIAGQEKAELKAHNARLANQQRLLDAVTRSGWAARRIRDLKAKVLARFFQADAPFAATGEPKAACTLAVARLKERQLLAGTSGHQERRPAGKSAAAGGR